MIRIARLILTFCASIALIMIAVPGSVLAQDSGMPATGLKQPTPEQLEWMKQNFPVIQRIHLNSLALGRVNGDRKAKGLAQLAADQMDLAPMGKEAVFATSGESDVQTTVASATSLPASVDNSASQAFPPIRSQGGIGSCVAWATTYYQLTYETNLVLGRNAASGDNTVIFSPKWTYNMINGGVDGGAYFSDAYNLELKNGAANYADFPYDSNYLSWDMNSSHWNNAINYRPQSSGSIYNSNVDTMIDTIKTQLANGHIMVIGTYVNSWVKATVGNDPSTTADDAFVGKAIASYEKNTGQGAHGMTLVGYNDDIWCDLNGNGGVNTGEKGAFKIANSWGTGDWNSGYRWITYDSLRTTSAAPAYGTWPTSDRASGGVFFSGTVYTLTVSSYAPTMKAEITLNQARRGQVAVTLGLGPATVTTPTTTWTSKAVYNTGGNWAFDGTSAAVDGTFVFDFSDLAKSASGTNRWFVGISDSTAGDITTIKSFKLYQGDVLVATASGLPKTVDAGQVYIWVDYAINTLNQPPIAVISASPTSGPAPLTVSFDGSTSTDTDGAISTYSWNFGDNSIGSGMTASHTYTSAGQYTATLTVTDDKGSTGSSSVVVSVINQPPTAQITATPTSGNAPLMVKFDGTASKDNDGTIVAYSWDFGDGTHASGAIVSHTYTAPGSYTPMLTVTDNLGATSSTTAIISVTADPNALNAPTGLTATVSNGKVTLKWTDNSINESGFYIERGVKVKNKYVYVRLATASANATSYTDTPPPGNTYYYRVQAYISTIGPTSDYSNVVSVRVNR